MSTARASDMLIAIWSFCEPEDREAFVSYLAIGGYLSKSPSADRANMEQADVDRSAERASSAVEVGAPVSPEGAAVSASSGRPEGRKRLQVAREPINAAEPDVLAATREGLSMERGIDQCVTAGETALNSQSDDDAFSEVKGTARPENAAGVEPSSSDNPSTVPTVEPEATPSPPPASGNPFPDPLTPVVATADQAHQASQLPAQNDDVPHVVGQGGHEPVNHYGHAEQEDASATQARNEPGSVSGATVTNPKPFCLKLKDGHCKIAFETAALCAQCNAAKARAA